VLWCPWLNPTAQLAHNQLHKIVSWNLIFASWRNPHLLHLYLCDPLPTILWPCSYATSSSSYSHHIVSSYVNLQRSFLFPKREPIALANATGSPPGLHTPWQITCSSGNGWRPLASPTLPLCLRLLGAPPTSDMEVLVVPQAAQPPQLAAPAKQICPGYSFILLGLHDHHVIRGVCFGGNSFRR
jgi:hypothetical protein